MQKCCFLALFAVLAVAKPNVTENRLTPVIANLLTLTRVTNGIGIQAALMRNPAKLNKILADCLDIDDESIISELPELDIEALSKDVDLLIQEVEHLNLLPLNWSSISTTVTDFEKLKVVATIEVSQVEGMWDSAQRMSIGEWYSTEVQTYVTELKGIMEITSVSNHGNTKKSIETLADNAADMKTMFDSFRWFSTKFQPGDPVIDILAHVSRASRIYNGKFGSRLSMVSSMFAALKSQVEEMNNLLKKSEESVLSGKLPEILDIMSNVSDTPGAVGGVDFEKMFQELQENDWLKQNIGHGENIKKLADALEPFKKVSDSFKSFIGNWTKIRYGSAAHVSTTELVSVVKTSEKMNANDLIENARRSAQCFKNLKISSSKIFDDFDTFYQDFRHLMKQIKLINATVNSVVTNTHFDQMLKTLDRYNFRSSGSNVTEVLAEVKVIQNLPNIAEISALMNSYASNMSDVDFKFITSHMALRPDFEEVQKEMNDTGFLGSLECLWNVNFDSEDLKLFLELQKLLSVVKGNNEFSNELKTFVEAVQSMAKEQTQLKLAATKMSVARGVSHSEESRGLLWMPVPDLIAYDLSRGVRVLQEVAEVFEHRSTLRRVAETRNDRLDEFVNKLPGIDGAWTPENKKALVQLVEKVAELNEKAKSYSNLSEALQIFEDAQQLSGAKIEGKLLGGLLLEAMQRPENAIILSQAGHFLGFPPLQLDYTDGKRMDLSTANSTRKTILTFFEEFFKKEKDPESKIFGFFLFLEVYAFWTVVALVAGSTIFCYRN